MMITVWVLVFYSGAVYAGGPAVIDNIATREECERVLAEVVKAMPAWGRDRAACIQVKKVARPW